MSGYILKQLLEGKPISLGWLIRYWKKSGQNPAEHFTGKAKFKGKIYDISELTIDLLNVAAKEQDDLRRVRQALKTKL